VLPSLTFLNLRGNEIGDEGAFLLAKNLFRIPLLQHLVLSFNSIQDKGIMAIARKLSSIPSLSILELQYNNFDTEGIEELSLHLKNLHQMAMLKIYKTTDKYHPDVYHTDTIRRIKKVWHDMSFPEEGFEWMEPWCYHY